MGEYVVRMDHTPRNCLECPLNGQCGIFADWVCTLNSLARKHYPQPFDKGCNILAVLPESHGRLVDAEKLKEHSVHFGETEYTFDFDAVFVEEIDEAPTIVPAEGANK